MQRRDLLKAMAAFGVYSMIPAIARGANVARKYDGVTLNVSTFSTAWPQLIRQWLPEFEALTGAKVQLDTPAFPVYNQRADLELSTRGSSYDVVNVTFIYTSRWINAGWLTPLDEFVANLTPADWGLQDFLPATLAAETGRDGKLYGIPYVVEAMLTGASRYDLIQQAGLAFPKTTDDLVKVLQAVNKKERVAGYVTDNHYGWTFIPYLQAFGGNVFRAPPDDLFPTLDTPEAVQAADYFARLIREFGPNGGITYTADQSLQALKQGRVNLSDASQTYLAQLGNAESSRTLNTAHFGPMVNGPKGWFPGMATHALGIPAGSKNKEAAWAFIQWALSKQNTARTLAAGYGSPTRRSDIDSPVFRSKQVINGVDLAQLSIDAIDQAGKGGYMKYRTVEFYPQVDQQLNKAIALIASGQLSAKEAMAQAQAGTIADLKRAGAKI
ncbi:MULTISPECIES: ABC transporter substrate-binding protein [Phytobacter]|uniref:ABC transporter substrate-binding protein n=1 Tax=Phytobacter diazotrophicus TaxID=395631 RepID=A0ABN6LTK5_9ENTR|nr:MULTISPECIES: extracellular solute-binding protein [Phytobacter]BBE77533.1 ABC transporter substrate-binding protein [Phytobacter sp. MRY16-398]BDD50903.1 ABC transporter substrate-binding protein [Phytobacter diazotrophicus]BEG81933.1 sugar ABC transporter substrate-binding protein [Phytobacter diazotrophicus]BEG87735.1 sugar ABC transporter substrate-binding protein [Phytobacter diazotrophicus]BEG93528.1 sugar ABC transporter substrate-binding protein [Phytobacter diazotrophicus]